MYLIFIQNNKIMGSGQCECLNEEIKNIEVSEEFYNSFNENPDLYIWDGEKVIVDPDYEKEQAEKREQEFKSNFFQIPNYGWYRKVPKGYSSAVESLNLAFNGFLAMQQLGVKEFPANTLIFYPAPDFYKPEECTEEWLVAHQVFNKAMSIQEFGEFYMSFMTAWNTQEHVSEETEEN